MTNNQFEMVSRWMINGNINEFVKANVQVDRLGLVGYFYFYCRPEFTDGRLVGIASRCYSRVDVYARRGDDTRGSEGSKFTSIRLIVPSLTFFKANILINEHGQACLADFGLTMIVSDPAYPTNSSSLAAGGTARWMSPERLDPMRFGVKDSRPTSGSDCYALGMVILEVLSGKVPFTRDCNELMVMQKVLEGERPGRPQGAEGLRFANELWGTLQKCWLPRPTDRPTVEEVLECLNYVSSAASFQIDLLGLGVESTLISFAVSAASRVERPLGNSPLLTQTEAMKFVEILDKVCSPANYHAAC